MVVHRIKLTNLVHVHHSGVVEDRIQVDLVQLHVRGIPVHRIAFEHELIVRLPELHLEWATGNDVFRVSPLVAVLLHNLARHDAVNLVRQQSEKEWRLLRQGYPQRVFVDCFYTDVFRLHGHKLFTGDSVLQLRVSRKTFVSCLLVARKCQTLRRVHHVMEG